MMSTAFSIRGDVAPYISVAFHQNAVPVVHEIVLDNPGETDVTDILLTVVSEPAFALPLHIRIERIAAGGTHHVRTPNLQLDAGFLRRISEGVLGSLRIEATRGNSEPLAAQTVEIQLHPPAHWGGSGAAPELLAAFVRPNEPAIDVILRDAASKLAAAGKSSAIDGYKTGSRQRPWELAGAIWAALASRGIAYVLPPASFERAGQKVRGPGDILERRLATCLDSTLMFAACLEQAHLNPLVVLTGGHAFVGLWLKDDGFPTAIVDDAQALRKRRDLEDMILIETTLLTHTPPARFQQAVEHAARLINEDAVDPLELAVDIKRARSRGIRPLELGEAAANVRPGEPVPAMEVGLDDAPSFIDEVVVREAEDGTVDRLERWKRKLLDLTLRNKLLHFRDTKKSIVIECPDPARLEDMLSGGQRFKLLPRTHVLTDGDERDATLFQEQRHDDGRKRFVLEALERGELHTGVSEQELDVRLTELYRMTRTAFEEGGSNVLFLALGFLKWTQKEGSKPCRAPLILLPVSLQRSSVRSGFRLAVHEEEARFNPTLLQMLRQDQKLVMPEVERELPQDAAGLDVARIWQIVRTHVRDLKGWEVTPDVVLSTFSFTKFLMWKDLVDRMEMLKRNPVVKHLIDTPKHSYGNGEAFPAPASLDRDHHPANLFAPLSADSSQLAAVLAAASAKDFVLFGPPGTGKSQTIANMISQCLALGKTVLFVSQKTAALEVVQRRLRDIGLGEYCLEVHSTKAQKSAVLGQLKLAWHGRGTATVEHWQSATNELAKLRDELNALVSALHRRRTNGMTAHEAFGRAVGARGTAGEIRLDWGESEHTPEHIEHFRHLIRAIRTDVQGTGDPAMHPLRGIAAMEWSAAWRARLSAAADTFITAAGHLEGRAEEFARSIGLTVPDTPDITRGLRMLGQLLNDADASTGLAFFTPGGGALRQGLAELGARQQRADALAAELGVKYRSSVFGQDLRALLDEWIAASNANFVVRGTRQRQVRQKLQPFATEPLREDIGRDLAILIEMQQFADEAEQMGGPLAALGAAFAGLETDIGALAPAMAWANRAVELSNRLAPIFGMAVEPIRKHIALLLGEYSYLFASDGPARRAYEDLHHGLEAVLAAQKTLNAAAGRADAGAPLATGPGWLGASVAIAQRWKAGLHLAQDWCNWNATAAEVRAAGLGPLIDAIEAGTLDPDAAALAFEAAYAHWWTDRLMTEDPVLRAFTATRQEDTIARFRAADERVAELTKRIVRARLGGDIPLPTAFGTDPEWGTLARELTKRAKHQPLRQLFANIPTVLTRLTPCVMMSPLSIAQYLPPDSRPFDVVIFDEASQIPVWDAIGAIARGNQVVIVGDPEQLPPTSVGERGVDDNDDGIDVEDQESILDECQSANIKSVELTWHYRSRHESLIAFSNAHYYKNRLVTFPSPVTDDRAVRYVHVPNGIYERGAGRVNREEARAVVAEIIRRLKQPEFAGLKSSLGVVTFNGEQQRLVENLLDQERRSHPELEAFFDPARWHEPVFVKNLENVQGDERDVILFSVAVAPDHGRPVATISSLNKEGGHRRLNVAITRARQEMVVFATLRPEQIDLSRTNARGVRDFKHFLEFAERGARAMAEAFAATGADTESPFEDAVKAALESRGWSVHTQIGVSAFRIDLGIVDPDAPGRYLAGVECDGATYHRSATARDRDRLREHVLTGLGWRIRRVWSTDWWSDANRALDRLHQQLEADLESSRATRRKAEQEAQEAAERAATQQAVEEPQALPSAADDGTGEPTGDPIAATLAEIEAAIAAAATLSGFNEPDVAPPLQPAAAPVEARSYADAAPAARQAGLPGHVFPEYRAADLVAAGFQLEPDRFHDPLYRARLRQMVAHVIAAEGPIYDDVLVRRIARLHGFARAGGRIRETVLGCVNNRLRRDIEDDRIVFWPEGANIGLPIPFRRSADSARDHGEVPLTELASLARPMLLEGAGTEETIRRMAAYFGLNRVSETSRQRFAAAIDLAHADDQA